MKTKTSIGWIAFTLALCMLAATLSTGLLYVGNQNSANKLKIERIERRLEQRIASEENAEKAKA